MSAHIHIPGIFRVGIFPFLLVSPPEQAVYPVVLQIERDGIDSFSPHPYSG